MVETMRVQIKDSDLSGIEDGVTVTGVVCISGNKVAVQIGDGGWPDALAALGRKLA